ncbi:MAG: hypothetical protein WC511_03365 [Candidatus Pacearchaeota archaeon]
MIEEKILGKCSSAEVREKVARGLRDFENYDSERKRVLISIGDSESWGEICAWGTQVQRTAEVLEEIGISTIKNYSPKNEFNSAYVLVHGVCGFEFFVASDMAKRMLKTTEKFPWGERLSLNKLYEETFLKN